MEGNYKQLKLAAAEIAAAERPVILAGHGILHADAEAELLAFAEKLNAPVAWTLLGIGAIDERHPLAYGFMGMHGWTEPGHLVVGEVAHDLALEHHDPGTRLVEASEQLEERGLA